MSEPDPIQEAEKMKNAWILAGRPELAPYQLSSPDGSDAAFEHLFIRELKFVSVEAMEQVMWARNLLPCPTCTKHDALTGQVVTRRLCIVRKEMPLGAKGELMTAICHVCNYQSQWPDDSREREAKLFANQAPVVVNQAPVAMPPVTIAPAGGNSIIRRGFP